MYTMLMFSWKLSGLTFYHFSNDDCLPVNEMNYKVVIFTFGKKPKMMEAYCDGQTDEDGTYNCALLCATADAVVQVPEQDEGRLPFL